MQTDTWVGQPTTARVTGDLFYYVDSPADAAVERMENERVFRKKLMLSWVALIEDPGCIEAHLFRGRLRQGSRSQDAASPGGGHGWARPLGSGRHGRGG